MATEIIKEPSKHEIELVKQKFLLSNAPVKSFQLDHLVQLKLVMDNLMKQWKEEGIVPDELAKISKNIVSLTDKMRRQDEGIKINADIRTTHEEFRDIIDVEAKLIEEAEIKDATIVSEIKNEDSKKPIK